MKNLLLTTFVALLAAGNTFAQDLPIADGYYRVKNYKTNRYVYVYDNTGKINAAAGSADVGALDLWKDLDRAISDPGSVLYAKYVGPNGKGGYSYDVQSQGTGVHEIIGYFVSIYRKSNGHLNIYASLGGFTKYLDDEETNPNLAQGQMGFNRTGDYQLWDDSPIDASSDNYFGVAPTISAAGKYYQPFYAEFPFNFASSGMKAFYVKLVDAAEGIAVIAEVQGDVPGEMPIFIECSSDSPSNNRLNLLRDTATPYADNQLAGVYFNNPYREESPDAQTRYDAETMRVLGVDSEGKLAFVKYNKTYLPANQSYLVVPSGTADQLEIMTEEDYNARIVNVAYVNLVQEEVSLVEGETLQLTVEVGPENASDPTLTWSSSDSEIVSVDANGVITALTPGTAVITAAANDGSGKEDSCTVTVEKKVILVADIVLNESAITLSEGETFQLSAEVTPADATDASLTWSSNDETIASVDNNGLVTAVAPGTAYITVVANDGSGLEATCAVTVEQNIILVSSIVLDVSTANITVGDVLQLTASVAPDDATDASLVWKSSDEALATVDESGLVKALAAGVVTITVAANDASGAYAECVVTIEPESGITAVQMDKDCASDVFTLSGIKVRSAGESLTGLVAGLYIVDGKKVIIY